MIGLSAAVRGIIANSAPILCLDTCSLLDLVRDPMRPKFDRRHAESALRLITRVESVPSTLTIVLTQQVVD